MRYCSRNGKQVDCDKVKINCSQGSSKTPAVHHFVTGSAGRQQGRRVLYLFLSLICWCWVEFSLLILRNSQIQIPQILCLNTNEYIEISQHVSKGIVNPLKEGREAMTNPCFTKGILRNQLQENSDGSGPKRTGWL